MSVVCTICERCRTTNPERICNYCKTQPRQPSEHARAIAAHEGLVRVALLAESSGQYCLACRMHRSQPHASVCVIDEALTLAGYPDRESRERARQRNG